MHVVIDFPARPTQASRLAREHEDTHMPNDKTPWVGILMGSKNDWEVMSAAKEALDELGIPCEARVLSAHRTPDETLKYAETAESRGLEVIIAGAGGAAHLAGVVAAKTLLPVLGVPIASSALQGMDALLSIVQMPKGIPVGTLAIGKAGAANAALLAAAIIGGKRPEIREKIRAMREARRAQLLKETLE
jgi:5-(carboxyamino)imidazole ribonucleotide mutase